MKAKLKVLIIDDSPVIIARLKNMLDEMPGVMVLGEVRNGREAMSFLNIIVPDVILLDLDLGVEKGLDHLPDLLERFLPARILVLTALTDTQQHLAAVASGASGVVVKEQAPEALLQAVEGVNAGEAWIESSLMTAVMGKLNRPTEEKTNPEAEKISRLTPREKEIVSLVSEGMNGEKIAAHLKISEATVRNHLTSILGKLGLANKFELAVYAHRHGLGPAGRS